MDKRHSYIGLKSSVAGFTLALAMAPSLAVSAEDFVLEEITVTINKREQSIQDIAGSVDAFDDRALKEAGIVYSADLQAKTPGLSIAVTDRVANVAIRGVSNNVRTIAADPSNATTLNGVYLPRAAMVLAQLFDVSRVEVGKGPQLVYGRNATGGAINIISADPSEEFTADGFLGYGSHNLVRGELAVSGGTEKVQIRLAGHFSDDDGYTTDLFGGQQLDETDYKALRGTIAYSGEQTSVKAFWQHSIDNGSLGYGLSHPSDRVPHGYGVTDPASLRSSPREIRIDYPTFSRRQGNVLGLTIEHDFENMLFRSITGYTDYEQSDSYDTDLTSVAFEFQKVDQSYQSYSQELQLISTDDGPLQWLVGAFFYWDEGEELLDYQFTCDVGDFRDPCFVILLDTFVESSSQAVYGQVSYDFTEDLKVILEGRFTNDDKTGGRRAGSSAGEIPPTDYSESKFNPGIKIQYFATDEVMIYASAAQGYKSGGIDGQDSTGNPVFGSENIWSYEAGFKGRFLDNRLTFNLSAFYQDYNDIQFRTAIFTAGSFLVQTNNESFADIAGIEVFLDADLGNGFSFDFAGAHIDSEQTIFDGGEVFVQDLTLTPRWSGTVGLTYEGDLDDGAQIRARVDYSFRSSQIFPFTPLPTSAGFAGDPGPFNATDSYGLLNATIRYTFANEKFYIEGIARNLTDELYLSNSSNFPCCYVYESYGPPQSFEIRGGFSF